MTQNKIKIVIVTGTRPELIKLSVLINLVKNDPKFDLVFIHSGQHYDENMFQIFLKELDLPFPNFNIHVGSHPNSVQTGKMLIELYDIIKIENPDLILAQGDTNTVFAAALTAFKNKIPFAHVEAGIRSYDQTMPEEINRILTGVCTRFNFAPTNQAVENLLNEGIDPKRIYKVGNTIVDSVFRNLKIAENKTKILNDLDLFGKKYVLMTLHRPSNVDHDKILKGIVSTLIKQEKIMFVFSIHPRTKKFLKKFNLYSELKEAPNFLMIEPVGYLDMIILMNNSNFILTDSGGIQEEATVLKKPCLTLRNNTERPETVKIGSNKLIGNSPTNIEKFVNKLWNNKDYYKSMIPESNPFGDGNSSKKILEIIKNTYVNENLQIKNHKLKKIPKIIYTEIPLKYIDKTVLEMETAEKIRVMKIINENGVVFPSLDYIFTKSDICKIMYNELNGYKKKF